MAQTVVPCTGPGIAVENGAIGVYGPRSMNWPYDCPIDNHNGIRYDSSGKVWAPPPADFSCSSSQPKGRTFTLGGTGTRTLGEFTYSVTTRQCVQSGVQIALTDGFVSAFLRAGDWWILRRRALIEINDEATHESERMCFFLAPSAVTNAGFAHPGFLITREVAGGSTVKATFTYFVDVLNNSGDDSSHIDLRHPVTTLTTWSHG